MKIVNRGYIIIRPKQPFIDWAIKQDEEYELDEFSEPNVYLIEEDFFEDEPVIKANFKKIFNNEIYAVSSEEENFPEITLENFEEWFSYLLGNTVFDCEKGKLDGEKI
jgi:hypothetical protein